MKQTMAVVMVLGAATLGAGCLQRTVSHTWYVDREHTVTWVVMESGVRSDAKSDLDRQNEELGYWLAVQRRDHPVLRGFRELGFADVRTTVLRPVAPYAVMTEVNGVRIDELGRRVIVGLRLSGTSTLDEADGVWTWTLRILDPHTQTDETSADLDALLTSWDELEVALVSGRFEDSSGFTLSPDRRIARFDDPEEQASNQPGVDPTIVLALRWRVE
jgi:hypothetical protein